MTTNMIFDQLHVVQANSLPVVTDSSQLPTASMAGRVYYSAADTAIYLDNGSSWNIVAFLQTNEVTANSNYGGANQIITSVGTAKSTQSSTVTADGSGNLTAVTVTAPTVEGATTASGNLTLKSTSHATKGLIKLGTSAYDEINQRLGIATQAPAYALDITAAATAINVLCDDNVLFIQSTSTHGGMIGFVARRGVDIRINDGGTDIIQFLNNSGADNTAQIIGRQGKSLAIMADGSNAARGVITRAASGQTALLHDFQNSSSVTTASIDVSGNAVFTGSTTTTQLAGMTMVAATASNAGTTTIAVTTYTEILNPDAAPVAGHTVKLPASPANGQVVNVTNGSATNSITALTVDGNGNTVVGGATSLPVSGFSSYQYRTTGTTWYRIG